MKVATDPGCRMYLLSFRCVALVERYVAFSYTI